MVEEKGALGKWLRTPAGTLSSLPDTMKLRLVKVKVPLGRKPATEKELLVGSRNRFVHERESLLKTCY